MGVVNLKIRHIDLGTKISVAEQMRGVGRNG